MDASARPPPSRQLTDLLSKALLDEELRERLFTDPNAVALEFCLPPAESQAIKLLERERFERAAAGLR
jgi:hypothetical protein